MKKLLTSLLLLFLFSAFAQQPQRDTIAKKLESYFLPERENIHVQLNKSIYTTNEKIWYKGYVYHRKKNLPFFASTNIQVSLMDEAGKVIDSQLLYGNVGTFSGSFSLGENFISGKYYLQFYTNWMNNFTEDESSVYEVTVINIEKGAGNALAGPDLSKINIGLYPEGGTFVNGVQNVFGVQVSDCNHQPLAVTTAEIVDASGKLVQKIQINKFGYGKVIVPPNTGSGYKATVHFNDKTYDQAFPSPQATGIAIEASTMLAGKTVVILRTNKGTLDALGNKPLLLLVHNDEQASMFDIDFKGQTELKMPISNESIFEGMNTMRIIDANLNQLAERMVFKYPDAALHADISTKQAADTITFSGKINQPNMSLSISIMPEGSRSLDEANDIYGSIRILPYIKNQQKANGRYYLSTLSKGKNYELDLFLACQKSKYNWADIVKGLSKTTYPFDLGITLKGTVPKSAGSTDYSKVRLYSLMSAIDESTEVDKDGNFVFANLFIADSAYVNFTLLRKGQKPKELTLAPQIINGKKPYNKALTPQPRCYASTEAINNGLPNYYRESTEIEEVKIDAKRLKYANTNGNSYLRAYKITDEQASAYQNLVNFIKTYGMFDVNDREGQLTIYSRTINTLKGGRSGPIIYVDNMQLLDYSMLRNIQMNEVDEIYMSAHAIVPSVRNYMGIIRIYLKKGAKGSIKNKTPDIMIKNAFNQIPVFENVVYASTDDEGFTNFGVVDWKPIVVADENGNFTFTTPRMGQKTIKVLIEGFSTDGKLYSEIKTFTLE